MSSVVTNFMLCCTSMHFTKHAPTNSGLYFVSPSLSGKGATHVPTEDDTFIFVNIALIIKVIFVIFAGMRLLLFHAYIIVICVISCIFEYI